MLAIRTSLVHVNTSRTAFKRGFVALAPRARQPELPWKSTSPRLMPNLFAPKAEFYLPLGETNEHRYKFDRMKDKIGQGFFATVYQATDVRTFQKVAVKVVDKKRVHTKVFKQELRVMEQLKRAMGISLLDSPLVVHQDVVETKSELHFVFDLFSGGDLCDDLIREGPMTESEIRDMMRRLMPGIISLHRHGFIHRDIKAENILLPAHIDRADRYKHCTLTDFGYGRRIDETDAFTNPAGTFGFVAPEVLSTRFYSTACDIWSLGAVLYTANAAYQPFPHLEHEDDLQGKTSSNLARKELNAINFYTKETAWEEEMARPAFKNSSAEFKDLLRKMLTVDPSERITAKEVQAHPWMKMP